MLCCVVLGSEYHGARVGEIVELIERWSKTYNKALVGVSWLVLFGACCGRWLSLLSAFTLTLEHRTHREVSGKWKGFGADTN